MQLLLLAWHCSIILMNFVPLGFFFSFPIDQLNISYPATGAQKLFEIVDEHKLRIFYEKRMGAEVPADLLGDEWKGFVLRIAGGNDKQGFPMKQGVLTHSKQEAFARIPNHTASQVWLTSD